MALQAIAAVVKEGIHTFESQGVSNVAWACATLQFYDAGMYNAISADAQRASMWLCSLVKTTELSATPSALLCRSSSVGLSHARGHYKCETILEAVGRTPGGALPAVWVQEDMWCVLHHALALLTVHLIPACRAGGKPGLLSAGGVQYFVGICKGRPRGQCTI